MALPGGVLTVALGKLKGGKSEPKEPEGDDLQPLEMAAEELIDAVDSKDPKAVAEALRGAIEICMNGDESDE